MKGGEVRDAWDQKEGQDQAGPVTTSRRGPIRLLAALCDRFLELFRPKGPQPQLWQVQIKNADELQIAQQEFPPHVHGFEILAWASDMTSASTIAGPKTFDVYREEDPGFVHMIRAPRSFPPTYLVAV